MKFQYIYFVLATCSGSAAAQGLSDLPSCAKDCATGSIPQQCSSIDVKCICSDKSFLTNISCCVATKCSSAEQSSVIKFADEICSGAGVNDLPSSASCVSGASATSTDASSTSTNADTSATTTGAGAASSTVATSAPATTTGGAPPMKNKDATLYAAAGVAVLAFLA